MASASKGLGAEGRQVRRIIGLFFGGGAGPQPLRCSALVLLRLVKGFGIYGVMLGAMGIRCQIVDQAFFQEGFCSSAALVETAAFYEVCRKLQTTAHFLHFVGDVQVVLHGLIAFGVRDDYRDALALNGIHSALPVNGQACGGNSSNSRLVPSMHRFCAVSTPNSASFFQYTSNPRLVRMPICAACALNA